MAINPAISGSKSYNSLTMLTRQQWLGFEGAPLTANISYHGALNNRSGIGGSVYHDRTGPATNSTLEFDYAYHIPLNKEKVNLSQRFVHHAAKHLREPMIDRSQYSHGRSREKYVMEMCHDKIRVVDKYIHRRGSHENARQTSNDEHRYECQCEKHGRGETNISAP